MVKPLEIKKIYNAGYTTLKRETDNFRNPVICILNEQDISSLKEVKDYFLDRTNHHAITTKSGELKEFDKYVTYIFSDSRWEKYNYNSFLFLTKDKIVSPMEYSSKEYTSYLDKIAKFFFTTPIFKEKLEDCSTLIKILIYFTFKKGIFGELTWKNLSSLANIDTWYSHGSTNTFTHSDHGLCNLYLQVEGIKRWWIASPYQKKELLLKVFNYDVTTIDFNNPELENLKYYDFELNPNEILYVPTNWLHSVISPKGLNFSLSFRFPMSIRELFINLLYWRSIGVPLNKFKTNKEKDDKTVSQVRTEQSEAFQQINFYLRKHGFATREFSHTEPEIVSGLYGVNMLNKALTGAEE